MGHGSDGLNRPKRILKICFHLFNPSDPRSVVVVRAKIQYRHSITSVFPSPVVVAMYSKPYSSSSMF